MYSNQKRCISFFFYLFKYTLNYFKILKTFKLRLDLISDRLQYTETASGYVNTLIEDVQKIFEDDAQERKNAYDENSSPKFSSNTEEQSNSNESSFTNSLGLALEGKHGINMVSLT